MTEIYTATKEQQDTDNLKTWLTEKINGGIKFDSIVTPRIKIDKAQLKRISDRMLARYLSKEIDDLGGHTIEGTTREELAQSLRVALRGDK